ncbi:MAG: SEFIR domain-containing protein [Desulfocucumaceae bacterium]
MGDKMQPKVFISYSWSSPGHQALVQHWAEQLVNDGIDVVLDIYDLKEGHDKYAFMEKMVTDANVTHVLVICDKVYSEKADARVAGVGTESQIISKEVYDKVEQSKFIPIVCGYSEGEEPYLPTFLKTRIWIDFSSPEKVNENWEQLVRLVYGKPLHEKPTLGKPPIYITSDTASPSSPAITKFNTFRQALLQDKKGLSLYRKEFLSACINYADSLRVRVRPDVDSLGKKVLEDCGKLKQVRNHIVDWVLLESETAPTDDFCRSLLKFLEDLRELKARPTEINIWSDVWFEAHSIFVYEMFLYIIAALLKSNAYNILHEVFTTYYLLPANERYGDNMFDTFHCFWGHSETLQAVLSPDGRTLYSPAAELIKRQADREDLPFSSVIEAELLTFLMSLLNPNTRWYPQTLHYSSYSREFPFFIRASQHKHFLNMAAITGISDANKLREEIKAGQIKKEMKYWDNFDITSFWAIMNMDKLDTLK